MEKTRAPVNRPKAREIPGYDAESQRLRAFLAGYVSPYATAEEMIEEAERSYGKENEEEDDNESQTEGWEGIGRADPQKIKARGGGFPPLDSNDDGRGATPKYMRALQRIADGDSRLLRIELQDLKDWEESEAESDLKNPQTTLYSRVLANTWRYVELFERAADALVPRPSHSRTTGAGTSVEEMESKTVLELINEQRENQWRLRDSAKELADAAAGLHGGTDEEEAAVAETMRKQETGEEELHASLLRRFEVVLVPGVKCKSQSLREVKSSQIGRLVTIKGIVTRVGDVLPKIVLAAYACERCFTELYQAVPGKEFSPLVQCTSAVCVANKKTNASDVKLKVKYSKFVKFQEIKIQELPDQVPVGNVPRTITVEARGDSSTRKCTAGDVVEVVGIFLPERPSRGGVWGAQSGLISTTFLRCMEIRKQKKSYVADNQDAEMARLVAKVRAEEATRASLVSPSSASSSLYDRLARSIAPEIYGHEDVKKAIFLMLVGGVGKRTDDGMSIRGDINVALFGDPGVAKSQLLKHVAGVAPRAVYTTGKGSSGVGLTAAVVRDSVTGEVALEGGALVLADMGVCCIDEFDKMEEGDRTAIHEVMEQQTVSIAKAGITTTLNARTSILAAANPVFGRYNKKLSPTENINLPAALLSRFDLLFLLLDKVDADADRALAEHITYVHRFLRHPATKKEEVEEAPFDSAFIRAFISDARSKNPAIPDPNDTAASVQRRDRGRRLVNHIVEAYVDMRVADGSDANNDHAKSNLTPRHLLSILRLATAHARVRGSVELEEVDVDEAIRLVQASKSSIEESPAGLGEGGEDGGRERVRDDAVSRIYRRVCDMLTSRRGEPDPHVTIAELEDWVLRMGLKRDDMRKTIKEYTGEMAVLYLNPAGTKLRFVKEQAE